MRTILTTIRKPGRALTAIGCAIALTLAAGCSTGTTSTSTSGGSHGPRIVAAENFWGSIATQLAGADGDVTSIITNPATDPHDYEASASDARTVASAQLVIENGIGYDAWMQHLIDANPVSGRVVLNVGDLLGIAPGGNPHQWYSRASVEQFISRLTSDLATVDPSHRSDYQRNEHTFETRTLAPYNALIAQIKHRYAGTPIGASESIVTPLAQTLGLKMMTPESFLDAIAEGTEPTANDKETADTQIRDHQIKVFVFNSQNSTPDVQRLVDESRREGIPVTTVTETLAPANASFQAWQVDQLRRLEAALASAEKK
jgi:zinc/manganese transport system substrate-binding protein